MTYKPKRTPVQIIGEDALIQLAFEGYAVVPVTPTEKMNKAFWRGHLGTTVITERFPTAYAAMLRAGEHVDG